MTGAAIEVLLLKRKEKDLWETLVKPGKKCRIGTKLSVNDRLSLEVEGITDSGERIVLTEVVPTAIIRLPSRFALFMISAD